MRVCGEEDESTMEDVLAGPVEGNKEVLAEGPKITCCATRRSRGTGDLIMNVPLMLHTSGKAPNLFRSDLEFAIDTDDMIFLSI